MIGAPYKICPTCEARCRADAVFCASCGTDVRETDVAEGDPYLGLQIEEKYRVEKLIGEGAMGRVYVAKQLTLEKPFAVKILAPHLMNDEASHARFAAEAHNCASLNHPNVVSVVDYGRSPEGVTYIVMEYIKGITLERIITEQFPLARERIMDLTLQILAALTEAHGLGILHRDLKPENILVQQLRTHGELAKVLDFGIAKLMDNPSGPGLTSAGMVCGTPEYMSPEQARGHKLDARSDLYAVGVILYQMLAGRPPFESESAVEILHKHLHEEPVPPSRLRGVPADPLEAVCLRALSKDPGNRYTTAMEFREELIAATSTPRLTGSVKCSTCGANLRVEHRFCPSCGAPAPTPVAEVGEGPVRRTSHNQIMAVEASAGGNLPLVGRDRQVQAARAMLGRPQAGLKLRVVIGAMGMGKTRLVDEMADIGEQNGWRVYYVSSDPTGARTPLFPVQTMVAQILEIDPSSCSTQDLFRAANLVGLGFEELPGLAELFRLQGPAWDLEHSVRRRECFASAVQAVLAGGRGQPLLLVFEDIDGYDNASREVLRRLAQRTTEVPVLVLASSKEASLDWLGGVSERLEPLDTEAITAAWREVAAQVTGEPEPPAALLDAAPMSPLRLGHGIRLAMRGTTPPTDATAVDLLRMRLGKQPTGVRRVLELASVLGERFPQSDLVEMARQDPLPWEPEDLKAALDRAHAEGLMLSLPTKERGFSHRTVYDAIYPSLEARRREQLHGLAADVSKVARGSTITRAVHLVRARDPRAPEVLLEAARYAERSFDDPTAADFLNAALRLSGMLTGGTSRALQAEVARHASRVMRSPEASGRAVELLRGEISRATDPADESALRCALGVQLSRLRKWDEALEALQSALGPAMQADDRATMMQVCKELGKVYARKGDRKRAITELREGLDMFTLGEGPRTTADLDLWRYLLRICELYRADDELAESRVWCEHALHQAERTGDHLGLMRCHGQMAWVLRDMDQLALGEQHLARALNEARHFGDRLTTTELLMERARARAARGRLAEALRYAEEALRLAQGIQWRTGIEHAERAISMLTQKEPPPRSSGPTDHSGAFDEPGTRLRDYSGPFGSRSTGGPAVGTGAGPPITTGSGSLGSYSGRLPDEAPAAETGDHASERSGADRPVIAE